MSQAPSKYSIICLSSQEWDVPLQTNRQRIMLEAAKRGHRVVFVETSGWIGTYLLRGGATFTARLRRLRGAETQTDHISLHHVVNLFPFSWRFLWVSRWNARLAARRLRRILGRLSIAQSSVTWIYDPRAIEIATRVATAVTVYDCVDDHAQTATGRARKVIAFYDRMASRDSDIVFVTSEPLARRHRELNRQTHLVHNVADFQHFACGKREQTHPAPLDALSRPIIGFAGNIIKLKVNLALVDSLSRARPDWTFVLIGPAESGMRPTLAELCSLKNVFWLGLIPYDDLPDYLSCFDVGLIPYQQNDYTASCFPLKLYEYLASGLPVVASGLPSLPDLQPDLRQVDGIDDMLLATEEALTHQTAADRERRRQLAAHHTWSHRAERLLSLTGTLISHREQTPCGS